MSLHEVEQLYDGVAGRYDEIISNSGWPAHDMLRDALAGIDAVDSALDLGAGTGLSSEVILETAQPQRLVAVDISAGMLEKMRQRSAKDPRLIIAKMAIEPFLAETQDQFDLIAAIGTLQLIRESDIVIARAARALSEGGHFMFTYNPLIPNHPTQGEYESTPDITFYRRAPAAIETSLLRSGLRVVSNRLFTANSEHQNGFVVASKD